MELKTITKKVVSYCSIPEHISERSFLMESPCNVYVNYSLSSDPKFDKDEIDLWLAENYPELMDTDFLIEMDY